MNYHTLYPDLSFAYLGPPLDAGPLPALFYFALSAQDSLSLAPFNQPVLSLKHLTHNHLRIFSITLPGHENNLPKEKALEVWAHEIRKGHDPITPCIADLGRILDYLFEQQVLLEDHIAFAGLSRGGYIATLAAAKYPCCKTLLGFAPLTRLDLAKEFVDISSHSIIQSLSLFSILPELTETKVRYYIGNRDTRVHTSSAFAWISQLAELAYETRAKQGSFEMIIHDSIGFMGHGTPQSIFEEGAQWIQRRIVPH